MVQPDPPAAVGHGLDARIGAQLDEFRAFVVRQPDLDLLVVAGQVVEPERTDRTRLFRHRAGAHVDRHDIGVGCAGPMNEAAVDEQVVHAGRAGRDAGIHIPRRDDVEFDTGRLGAKYEPYAGGLRFGPRQLRIGALGAGPGGQTVRQDASPRLLEFERTKHKRRSDGGSGPVGLVERHRDDIRLSAADSTRPGRPVGMSSHRRGDIAPCRSRLSATSRTCASRSRCG